MNEGEVVFRKVTAGEKARLLQDVHAHRTTILFKFTDSGVYRVKAGDKSWGSSIHLPLPANLSTTRSGQEITGNFLANDELYFFKAPLRIVKKQMTIELTTELHQLIRRRAARYRVPARINLYLTTKRVGDRLSFFRASILDLSLTGCRALLNSNRPMLQDKEMVSGVLRLGDRKPIEFTGQIRHRKWTNKLKSEQMFGVEFTKMEDTIRFHAWVVDIQRAAYEQGKR